MKIAWLLAWALASSDVAAQLRFATEESLDEIQEDETYKLTPVQLETSPGVSFVDGGTTWSRTYYQLLISCDHGTVHLDREVKHSLVDTMFLCVSGPQRGRSMAVFTTAREAQQILSSIIYQPDLNYHSTWHGVTDPLCTTEHISNEIVRMQLSPVNGDHPEPSNGSCVVADFDGSSVFDTGGTHEKKVSVSSVNDPPTVEQQSGRNLSVVSGGSCIGLYGFKLRDVEADAIENSPKAIVPILTLQLSVKFGNLRVNRRSALQNGIHISGNGKPTRDVTFAWKKPDLFDSTLMMKGAISDLNEFLPKVEYCSSTDFSIVVPDTLRVTLSDKGFCGSLAAEDMSAYLVVPIHIFPTSDLGDLSFTKTNITLTKHLAAVPLTFTPASTDEMECTFGLKYHDGMLLGIDYQAGTRYGKPDMQSLDPSKTSTGVLIPSSGLIIRFWDDKLEPTSFKFARDVCATQDKCHQVESTTLYEGASDGEIIAAAQMLTRDSESVSDLQIIRYPVSRLWLIWNIPDTFSQGVFAFARSRVSVQTVKRHFRLQGKHNLIAAQLKTLKIYSLTGGVWKYNNLNVTISSLDKDTIYGEDALSAQLDIFASPVLENVELLHPPELILDESRKVRLETVLLYPSTYVTSSALKWTVRSTLGAIWWDLGSVSSVVVSSQLSEKELELHGNLVDLNAALSSFHIDESTASLSKTLFQSSLLNPGSETQTVVDTITMVLKTLDTSTVVTSGTIQARVSRMVRKLGIRLPLSYVQVDLNQTLTIDGVGFDGYAHELSFSVSCNKGTISFLNTQPAPTPLNKPTNSTVNISGYFSTVEEILHNTHLIYTPLADATGYDRLVFTVESIDDQAIEILPIVINSPVTPPSMTLPTSPIYAFENEYVPVAGVMLNFEQEYDVISRGITVDIASRSGQVELMTHGGGHNPRHNAGIRIQGDSENINAALKELRYKPPVAGAPEEDQILFSTSWEAESEQTTTTTTFVVSVKIIKRSPPINVLLDGKIVGDGSVVATTMNTPVSLKGLFIQVDDGDNQWNQCNEDSNTRTGIYRKSCNATIHLLLVARHGLISNHTNPLSQVREQDSRLSLVRFGGSVAHANIFLQQQVYIPDDKFFGPDHVVITIKHFTSATDDKGAIAEDTTLLSVFVAPDCEAPQLFWADSGTNTMSFNSSSRIPFTLPEILFVRAGLEKGLCQDVIVFRATVQADRGFLTLKSSMCTSLVEDPRSLILEGRIWDLNSAFKSMEYQFEIQRDTQIPVTANITVRVEGEIRQKKDLFADVSSAQLRLKFTGDIQPPDLLSKVTIVGSEDTDLLIGDAINMDALTDLISDSTITINVHNGVVYASANGINMKANSEQKVNIKNTGQLRSVMTNLRYTPNPNFNGIDEIDFRMGNQYSTLYIYVEAKNDPPELTFNSEEMKDWYNYPRMFIPSVQLSDPEENQMFQISIRVDNGSLFLDQASSSTFDGVTVELSSSASRIRMTSRLSRLNTILLQRLVEVIPNKCMKEEILRISCAASIELCVDDGFITVCEEFKLPEQNLFYHVTVPVWAESLNVSAGSSLNISGAFTIHQKFDVMYDFILRIHSSSGVILIDVPSCGKLHGMSIEQRQRSNFIRTIPTIYASDVTCLNTALSSLALQTTYGVNDTIAIQLELFSDKMRLMTSKTITVKVTDIRQPKQIRSLRTTDDGSWKVRLGSYTNLTSLVNVLIISDTARTHEKEAGDVILELNVSCSNCLWQYQAYVPGVSYEFAQIPSSRLRFLGLSNSLNSVLATLEFAITSTSSSNDEIIHFYLAPVGPDPVRRTDPIWIDSTNVSIPVTIKPSPLVWKAEQASFIVQSPNFTASLRGLELTGKEELVSFNLTIRFECTNGEATVSMKPTFLERRCGSGESAVSFTIQRSHVNEIISSTLVKVKPKPQESRVELRLVAIESAEGILSDSASIDLHFRSLRQLPMATMTPDDISAIQVNKEEVRSVGAVLVVHGDLNDSTWFRMIGSVAHGQLNIPYNVCCVDIRETERKNELDVVGPALALKDALAATQFQSDKRYVGKDSLEVVISHFSSGQISVSFSIPIEVAGVHELTITHQRRADSPSNDVATDETTITFESVGSDIELLSGFEDFEAVKMCETPDLDNNFAMVQRGNNDDFKLMQTIPLIHIDGSIEGPLSSNHWEVISIALEIGKSFNIPGIFISDGSGGSIVSDDDLTLEISAGIGSVFLTVWDGLQMVNEQESTLTVVGKIIRLNAALATLRYQCSGACSHDDDITLRVTNPVVRPPASHQRTIRVNQIYVVPVPRVATNVSLYYSTEDAAFQFSDLTLNFANSADNGTKAVNTAKADYRKDAPIYQLVIRVSYGTISIITTDSFTKGGQLARKRASNHLELEGTVINLERDLNRVVYFSPQNWNKEQSPGGHLVEWQFVVSYQKMYVESFADLVVMSRIDAPVISVPEALEDPSHSMSDYLSTLRLECLPLVCDEDTPMILDGFSVRAADATPSHPSPHDLLLASFSVSHGIISFGDNWRTNCIRQFVGDQSWKRLLFNANADCINRVLSGMVYVGEPNFSGTDQLKLRVEYARELDGAFDEVIIPIIVFELNDAPYIEVNSVFYETEEDIPLVIDNLHLRDPDTLDRSLRVILDARYGQLALLKPNGVKVTTKTVKSSSRLMLEGTVRNLDIALSSVVYTSAQDWNSLQLQSDGGMNGFDTITIHSTDFSSFNGSSVSVLFIYVEPTPDPVLIDIPSNAATSIHAVDPPGTLRGDEDTWITLNGLTFSCVDDTSQTTLVVSLSVTNGILSLSSIGGITLVEGTVDGSNMLTFKGTFAMVNERVVNLRYLPKKDFYGQDSLVVTANAIDEYTQQHTPLSSIRVAITVDPVNDAPVWNIGSSIVREIQQDQAASISGVYFSDVDVATMDCSVHSCVMDLTIKASDGLVVLPGQLSPQFSNDMTTKKATYTVISGTPDELNVLLSRMTFELGDTEFYRADDPSHSDIKLQLTVDDRGTFGWGGPQISTTTVVFNPVLWSRYDFSVFAPEGVLMLDEDTTYTFDGNLQLVDPDSARSFHNLLELTITCDSGTFALSNTVAGVQVLRNNSNEGIVVRGFFAQLNAALNGSSYIPVANWYGSEELSLSVVELNRLENSKESAVASIFLFIAPVCDESRWSTLTSNPLTMKEDEYLLIDTLSLTNPDDDDQREVLVTIGVKHGGVMLSMTNGLLIHEAVNSTSEESLVAQHATSEEIFSRSRLFFKDLVFLGRVSDINAALKGMIFKPWLDYNSNGWPVDEIVLVATSACGSTESISPSVSSPSQVAILIAVNAVNDPPMMISQHFQRISPSYSLSNLEFASSIEAVEDSPRRLESTELYDPDFELSSGDLRLLVNISCIHCTITSEYLSHSSETQPSDDLIVVTRNWKNDEGVQLVVHGNLPSLNSGLMNQLIFRGVDNFNGVAFVLVEISDLGNYGKGGEQRSLFVLGVQVRAVNDKPQIYLPQYQSLEPTLKLDENSSVLIQGAPALSEIAIPAQRQNPEWNVDSMRSITLQDVEAMQKMQDLTVSLNCSKGWLSLGRQCDGVAISLDGTPDNAKAAILTLRGSLSALNCAVEKVTYHSKPMESGWDEIHVTLTQGLVHIANVVDDTQRDSSYTVSKRMLVEIHAINHPPSISMATTFFAPMGRWVAFTAIEITDPDSADGILYVSVAVRSGELRITLLPHVNGDGPTSIYPTTAGDTSQILEFATTVGQASKIFGALEYKCNDAYAQLDYFTVQVDDNGFTGSRGPQVATMTTKIIVISETNV